MKILAIRGKNLASLAGEFAIDFLAQPLASAGLFAISGPTGAGKSTLLDALCLALFDKTPRLQQAGSKGVHLRDVGDETLPPYDVRNLLRRGCAEGYAEVEFIGNDRQHYCSRWSVRRARLKADGKLQASEMTLLHLPEQQAIGGKKTEVQDAIVEKLGLNFDQFTRAVLLAQNEFSVFLKAPDDERASLLETLTGTDEYSRISIRAFERAKQEKQKLDTLQQQLAAQQPLAEQERQVLIANLAELNQRVEQAQQQKKSVEAFIQWHQRYQVLQSAEQEAQSQLQLAQEAHQHGQGRRDHLQLLESLQSARPLLTEYERLQVECQQQQRHIAEAETAVVFAQDSLHTAQKQQATAEQLLQSTEQRKAEAELEIVKARALETEIHTLQPQQQKQQQSLLDAHKQLTKLQQSYAATERQQQETEQALASCGSWLENHAEWAGLSEQWPRWQTLFKQGKTLDKQLTASRLACTNTEVALTAAESAMTTMQGQLDELLPSMLAAQQGWENAEAHAKSFNAEALSSASEQQQNRLAQLRQADGVWQALVRLTDTFENQTVFLQNLALQRLETTQVLGTIDSQLPTVVASHEQAAKMLELAKLACSKNVEALRAQLKPESECPVCGSTQHPYIRDAHPLRDELQALTTEVQECLQRRQQAEKEQQRLNLELQQFDKQTVSANEALAKLTSEIETQRQMWLDCANLISCLVVDEQVSLWLTEQISTVEQGLHAVSERLKAMSTALLARDQARRILDDLNAQQQVLHQQLEQAKTERQTAELARNNAHDKQQASFMQREHVLDELDAAFVSSTWRQSWLDDADGFYQRCLQQVQDWLAQQTQREQLTNQLSIVQTTLHGLQGNVTQAETYYTVAANAFKTIDAELQGKLQQRQQLLNGKSVAEVEAGWVSALNEAKAVLQAAVREAQSTVTQVTTAQETVSQLTKMLVAHQQQLVAAEQHLMQWLQALSVSQPTLTPLSQQTLRQYLQHEPDWLIQEREAIQQLDKALAQAQTVLNERRQQCELHLQSRGSLESLETLESELAVLASQLKGLTEQLSELTLQRRIDDERLQASAGLHPQIAAQSAVNETWAKLNALIGSADGKRFRNIAQQLTLDILLGYANQHLKDISRRYRLERVGDTLALQVVDQDMGDEIRSVHSLSGGESFLLSLALALGLASLSSNRVRVESLFIDEGFGSLDADTLRVALDALDSLQAMGRKVGVISHVQEMTERIGTRIEVKRVGRGLSQIIVSS